LRAELPAKCDSKMSLLVQFLKDNPGATVSLQGHLDQRESQDHAVALIEQRAESVRAALVAAGIDSNRIRMTSGGEAQLVCSAQAESCWELNRRVEVQIAQTGS